MKAQAQPMGIMDIVSVCSQKTQRSEAVDLTLLLKRGIL